ncbi:hypothetical protein TRIXIE_40 [Mycobacterium phage Trixie]|uniref:Uncharacterized protein n=1 Tax=Mycobacterium phage Trixie TaxID=1071503 RepID=G1JV90_9CAUD|nr:hypothetical protein TRIXIE_40 [Mycobacterium phage Trixie]AEL17919.1 hypothetical protein TRIXIE_40 [Mycobacterium phage Trixie]
MYEAEDHQFFDELYQQWTRTTGAENNYWLVEEDLDEHMQYRVVSFNPETEEKRVVGQFHTEADADFVAGLNGALPDLIRRLHEAVDEAVRKDEANDIAQGQLAEALLENIGLSAQILELERQLDK